MILTIVTYEYPAAQHLIDEWHDEELRKGRLARFETAPEPGCFIAKMSHRTERLFIVAMPDGGNQVGLDWAIDWAWAIRGPNVPASNPFGPGTDLFDKMLHFGKVPVSDTRWLEMLTNIKPSNSKKDSRNG